MKRNYKLQNTNYKQKNKGRMVIVSKVGMVSELRRLKASKPLLYANSNNIYSIPHFNAFAAGSVHLKEAFRRPEGPYRSPMPWGPLAAGGKKEKVR